MTNPLRIAFLAGSDSPAIRTTIRTVCELPCVQPVAILLDTAKPATSRRFRNFRRNVRKDGAGYALRRAAEAINRILDKYADRVIPRAEVDELLRKTFPESTFTLSELSLKLHCPLLEVGNLNESPALDTLRECAPDLGVVLGTRILKRPTFSIPALGCINLHKGKVPEFRGMPPAFWELYEGAESAGVTVHFVDEGLDTGDIIGTCEIPIHRNETEISLRSKLDREGALLITECIRQLQAGTAQCRPQPPSTARPRTRPTRQQRQELARRRPGVIQQPKMVRRTLKTAFYLASFHLRIYSVVRWLRRATKTSRAAVVLYHRVNDFSVDPLTTSTRAFAEHLVFFNRYYRVCGSEWLIDRLRRRQPIAANTLAIHFDDCYRDVFTLATPLLKSAGMPATAFISSGFIGTTRAFQHDLDRYPFVYENLNADEVRKLPDNGVSIGAHTVNHVDLGTVSSENVNHEIVDCKKQLETVADHPVTLFSFPFGKKSNIREDVRELIKKAGFQALFSAHGGFVHANTDVYDVPRIGVSSAHRPLDLMMELEGITLTNWL